MLINQIFAINFDTINFKKSFPKHYYLADNVLLILIYCNELLFCVFFLAYCKDKVTND